MMMNDIIAFVKAQDMTGCDFRRFDCPKCGNKNTFCIRKDYKNLLYYCHHNSCTAKGSVANRTPSTEEIKETIINKDEALKNGVKKLRKFSLPENFVTLHNKFDAIRYLSKFSINTSITSGRAEVMYDIKEDRLVFLCMYPDHTGGEQNVVYNAVGRDIKGDKRSKWRLYQSPNVGFRCTKVKDRQTSTVIVVEDAVSACCVSAEADGYALLGTHLNDIHKLVLSHYDEALIFLDPDADQKAVQLVQELKPYVVPKILFSYADPKDITTAELKRIIRSGKKSTETISQTRFL